MHCLKPARRFSVYFMKSRIISWKIFFCFSSLWHWIRFRSMPFKILVNALNTWGARYLTTLGRTPKAFSFDESIPWWSGQQPLGSQASGSPQSQQPLTLVFSHTRCPVWSDFWKHSKQMIQVGSFSQSSHFQATSPYFKVLAQTPSVKWSSHRAAMALSG
jgi:hypothetical protein